MIALLRSLDMPIAEIRRLVAGAPEPCRLYRAHRTRLAARLAEVRRRLAAVDALTEEEAMRAAPETPLSGWLHLLLRLPVRDLERSIAYYREALGFWLSWRTADGTLAALASGGVEVLLLEPWTGAGRPPAQAAYVYVEDPDALCAAYRRAGADVVAPVASRPNGMRDFTVRDPDGHLFKLGRGEAALRDVAAHYGLTRDEIAVNPDWLERRQPRR